MRRTVMALSLLGAVCGLAQARDTSPDLPVAEWTKGSTLNLEDFRGQVTALVFYDDNQS